MARKLFGVFLTGLLFTVNLTYATPDSFRDVVKKVNPAVVYIQVTQEREVVSNPLQGLEWIPWGRDQRIKPETETQVIKGSGSGVIIDAEKGYVLTAAHVVENVDKAVVYLPDGREFEAIDFLYDSQTDVGLVQIEMKGETIPQIQLGDSDKAEVGDWVLAMGSPLGKALANSVSAGIVSGKSRKSGILGKLGIEEFSQTDAVINRGNSGGPLVNMDGEIIGINSNIISQSGFNAGLGFAVPSNIAKEVVSKLITDGVVVRGWLGVTVAPFEAVEDKELLKDIPEGTEGAFVVDVLEDGPADKGGIKANDVILSVDGQGIANSAELIRIISSLEPDNKVKCELLRNGKKKAVTVALGVRPGTGNQGGNGIITRKDKKSDAYKKLGIAVELFDQDQGDQAGVVIRYVKPDSLAEEFGVEVGDIVLEINGQKIEKVEDIESAIEDANTEDGILLTLKTRKGKVQKVYIKDF